MVSLEVFFATLQERAKEGGGIIHKREHANRRGTLTLIDVIVGRDLLRLSLCNSLSLPSVGFIVSTDQRNVYVKAVTNVTHAIAQ